MKSENSAPISLDALQQHVKASPPISLDQLKSLLRPKECVDNVLWAEDQIRDNWQSLTRNQIDALKTYAEIQFKKLSKTLPDIRSIEHNAGQDHGKVQFIINYGVTDERNASKTV